MGSRGECLDKLHQFRGTAGAKNRRQPKRPDTVVLCIRTHTQTVKRVCEHEKYFLVYYKRKGYIVLRYTKCRLGARSGRILARQRMVTERVWSAGMPLKTALRKELTRSTSKSDLGYRHTVYQSKKFLIRPIGSL